jgi:hypothetical protein
MTVHEPVPYDPVASGCWNDGVPLAWAGGGRIGYALSAAASHQTDLEAATRAAHLAFDAWNKAACAGGGTINAYAFDDGPVSADAAAVVCGATGCDPPLSSPAHLIVFDDAAWPYDDPNNTLALTTVTYVMGSGEIYDADIEVNTAQHTILAEEPAPAGAYDLQAILTHEAGHFLGMAHATETSAVMYARYQPGAIALTTDDIDGICAAYPPLPSSGKCSLGRTVPGGWSLACLAWIAALAMGRRRFSQRLSASRSSAS